MNIKNKKIIILIGPPGSGKGTQADLLAKKFNLIHLETSKLIEEKFKKIDQKNKELLKEKKRHDQGKLTTSKFVVKLVLEEIEKLAKGERGIVFSGSPRKIYEAWKEIPILERYYGKENISVVYLKLREKESIKRNSVRKICAKNRHPIPATLPGFKKLTLCPWDNSKIITRVDDKPELIKRRYRIFLQETKPVLNYFKKHNFKVFFINGEQPIKKVFQDILKLMK